MGKGKSKATAENMQNLNLKLLSEALGEVARGFKKLKTVVDGVLNSGEKVPVETDADQEKNGNFTPATNRLPEPPIVPSEETAAQFLLASKVQQPDLLATEIFDYLFKQTLRADRYHNQWVADANAKKGWRKISEVQLETYRQHARNFHCNILWFWYNLRWEEFSEKYGSGIHQSKWDRMSTFEDVKLEKKDFRTLCCHTHNALPPLR